MKRIQSTTLSPRSTELLHALLDAGYDIAYVLVGKVWQVRAFWDALDSRVIQECKHSSLDAAVEALWQVLSQMLEVVK